LIKTAFFRPLFAGCIIVQAVLFAAVMALISAYWPSEILLALSFIGLLAIGAGDYKLFQRLTQEESARIEATRGLAERARAKTSGYSMWRRVISRCAVWIPAGLVVLACLFLDETVAFTSHVFQPSIARLLGYRVSIPLHWTVAINEPGVTGKHNWSTVSAVRSRNMLRNGIAYYLRRQSSTSISWMSFYGSPPRDVTEAPSTLPRDYTYVATRSFSIDGVAISCQEFIPQDLRAWSDDPRFVRCSAPRGDLFCTFTGSENDVADFYRTLRAIRKVS
jgi:hypothetical protein